MKVKALSTLMVITLLLMACQTISRVFNNESATSNQEQTSTSAKDNTSDNSPSSETTNSTSASEPQAETDSNNQSDNLAQANLPVSTLFEQAWDDHAVFKAGLIADEQDTPDQFPNNSVYHIELTVSDDRSTLMGREEVHYTNSENADLQEIYFHLYPNLLGGSVNIANLTINGEPAIFEYLYSRESVMKIPLSTALQPGQAIIIGMDFEITVPQTQDRNYGIFANVEEILAAAHFYPLIATYDDRGWDIEVPSPQGDVVFADSSFYLVSITAPTEMAIVASGVMVSQEETGSAQTSTFAAGPMRDFYFVATEKYGVISQTVDETTIHSYYLPGREASAESALQYAVDSLKSFKPRYGQYPFTELDIVPTANLALGIEYPGIVAINATLYDPNAKLGDWPVTVFFESTVVHEVAHQWFYSLVGNDQLAEPWVDESLTQYATWRYYLDTYGQGGANGFEQSLRSRWERLEFAEIPIGQPVSEYDGREYSAIVYGRGPLFFDALADEMGQETLDAFLLDYALTFRWGIAYASDLQTKAEAQCACQLDDLFNSWVYGQ
ncbi:MAG: M1 family metallopeptidase [Chloroflexota bacterium]